MATYLWGYAATLTAAVALAAMAPDDLALLADLRKMLEGLEEYWCPEKDPPAYRTTIRGVEEDERFYDDNEWLASALLEAHRLLGEDWLYRRAIDLFRFVQNGVSEEMGGGIFWKEGDHTTKNTCSNGPAVVLALELWRITGDPAYLEWARPIYEWTRKNLQSPTGVYWDRIEAQGTIEPTTWTYNTGIMIQAAVLWFEATRDRAELEEARRLAQASLGHFAPETHLGVRIFPPTPWFNSILFHGYEALYRVDGDPSYVKAMALALDQGWYMARDRRGLVHRDWSGRTRRENEPFPLLDQAPIAELWARLSALNLEGM
ncbi:MAG: glycoside hydrolase family 76 protein [Firmicutes bacterium]|nr:glycoside hydrolase family 76 protein [Bacillota bacterium]